jgi:hypothetical protein
MEAVNISGVVAGNVPRGWAGMKCGAGLARQPLFVICGVITPEITNKGTSADIGRGDYA